MFEDIYEEPLPTSGLTSVSDNIGYKTGQVKQPPSTNITPNMVTTIEDISKEIQKYTIKQSSKENIGAARTT